MFGEILSVSWDVSSGPVDLSFSELIGLFTFSLEAFGNENK